MSIENPSEVNLSLQINFSKALGILDGQDKSGILYEGSRPPRHVFAMEFNTIDDPSTFWNLTLDPEQGLFEIDELGPWEPKENFSSRRMSLPRIKYHSFVDLEILEDENIVIFHGENWSFRITRRPTGELEFRHLDPIYSTITLNPED